MNENQKATVNNSPTAGHLACAELLAQASQPTGEKQPPETKSITNVTQPNADFNEKRIAPLKIVDGNTLMGMAFEPLQFAVEKILPHGLFILAGSPKIGKSWLSLDICRAVATGGCLWEFSAEQGDVLYLALEDNYNRLQNRLKLMEAEKTDISKLHLSTASYGLQDGLLEQIHRFLAEYSGTKLIVIDTLEHIRNNAYDKNMYACDYRDMNRLREITNKHKVSLILVHHTRKMFDPDPLNTISGSTGLVGAVDGVFVLEKTKRTTDEGKLTIANRDTEGFCFKLEFDKEKCRWLLIEKNADESETEDNICAVIDDFLQENWRGTATELCNEIKKLDSSSGSTASTIAKELKSNTGLFKKKYGIEIGFERNRGGRLITLTRLAQSDSK